MKTKKGKLRGVVALVVTLMMLVSLMGIPAAQVIAQEGIELILDPSANYVWENDTINIDLSLTKSYGGSLCNITVNVVDDSGPVATLDSSNTTGGDYNVQGVMEGSEEWTWTIYNYEVSADTHLTATASAQVCTGTTVYNDVQQDFINVIYPDTLVTITPSDTMVAGGSTVGLTVTETNTGDTELTSPSVYVTPGGYTLNRTSNYYQGGDQAVNTAGYGVLDLNETWTWVIPSHLVGADTTFTATGHGFDPAGNDITAPEFPDEQATVLVETFNANTNVNIITSDPIIRAGQTVDLTVMETNTGIEILAGPSVVIYDYNGVPMGGAILYTLDKASGWYDEGDTNDDGYLDPGETWKWVIEGVTVSDDTTYEAIGHGTFDPGTGTLDVTYPAWPGERSIVSVNTIDPLTYVSIAVAVDEWEESEDSCDWYWRQDGDGMTALVLDCTDPDMPDTYCLAIGEVNWGDDPLTDVYVEVFDKENMEVPLYTLDMNSESFWEGTCEESMETGDLNDNGILDPGIPDVTNPEVWMWLICDIPVDDDITYVAIGHGTDSLGDDVTWYSQEEIDDAAAEDPPVDLVSYDSERDEVTVNVYCPNTRVDVCVWPCTSTTCVHIGDMFDLRISEENTGNEPIYGVQVYLRGYMYDDGYPTYDLYLDKDSEYYIGGDTNDDGVLDPGEMWRWRINDIVVPTNEDYDPWSPYFEAWGYGVTAYPQYLDVEPGYETIAWETGYDSEYDKYTVCVIEPGTDCCISASEDIIRPNTPIDITVTEANTGDQPLTNVVVKVYDADDMETPLYILTKDSEYYVSGDTDGDGVLDESPVAEEWSWFIPGVVVAEDTSFIAIGDGIDPLGAHVTYPEYQNERGRLDVDVINPDTEVTVCVDEGQETIYADSDDPDYPVLPINITVTETNTGDDPLTDAYVWLGALDLEGATIDINPDVPNEYVGYSLVNGGAFWVGGDLNDNGILDPGEIWTWYVEGIVIASDDDVRIIVKGHGNDSLGEDVAYPEYRNERDWFNIDVINPNTDVDICTYPCLSPACVYEGEPFAIRVDEINTGDDPITDVWVEVYGIPDIADVPLILDKDSGSAVIPKVSDPDSTLGIIFSGDANGNGILDPDEMWTWIITEVEIDTETTFQAFGYGYDSLDGTVWGEMIVNGAVSLRNGYDDEYDDVTVSTIDPSTYVYIYATEAKVTVNDMIGLTVSETNNGDCDLTEVNVKVYANDVLAYTLVKGDEFYAGGDTDNDGIMDNGETWSWYIPEVVVNEDTTYVAIGDGIDPLNGHVTWYSQEELDADSTLINYPFERSQVVVETIGPNTKVSVIIDNVIYADDEHEVTVTEENNGDESLENPFVWIGGRVPVTGEVMDINDDLSYNGFAMGKYDVHYVSGDTNGNDILDPGETWTWVITEPDLVIVEDVRIIAKGHGTDSLGNDITYYSDTEIAAAAAGSPSVSLVSFANERDIVDVNVIDPNTEVCISCPGVSIPENGTVDITVTEENLGDDPITNVRVTLNPGGYILTKDSEFYVDGDKNGNGILDTDDPATEDANEAEIWRWIVTGVTVDESTTFEGIGDGIDSAGNHVTYPEYPDERDRLTIGIIGTTVDICCPGLGAAGVNAGQELTLTINERNTGDIPVNDAYVWVGGLDPVTMSVLDINPSESYNGFAMGISDPNFNGGDTNGDGVLDPGETWTWVLRVTVNEDVLIVTKGHGSVSGVEGDIAYPEYPNERDAIYVEVIEGVS